MVGRSQASAEAQVGGTELCTRWFRERTWLREEGTGGEAGEDRAGERGKEGPNKGARSSEF